MTAAVRRAPSWRVSTLLLAALSLSIGWGVRGNFGHEYGAMLPGVLAGIALCLASGREDWRARVLYAAMFGGFGWAFGGSMSYMKVVNYTQTGDLPSQIYGFFGLFAGGFLWSAMGGAGTAYALTEDGGRLTDLFKPLCWVLAVWTAFYFLWEPGMKALGLYVVGPERGLEREARQCDPFYWLDSDWVPAFLALAAVCAFDLWDRRFEKLGMLALLAAGGGAAGAVMHFALTRSGLWACIGPYVVRVQGDLSLVSPDTGQPFNPLDMVTNWPQLFTRIQESQRFHGVNEALHGCTLGLLLGVVAGVAAYFTLYGKWRSQASLLVHLGVGWFVVFLAFPVLLGVRMTPPRNDNWAGMVGMLLGLAVYARRTGQWPVVFSALVCGTVGGLGIAITQCLKMLLVAPGNPTRLADLPAAVRDPIIARWAHWQSANWHSIVIEQGVGLIYGLGLALAVGLLAARLRPASPVPRQRKWTEVFAAAFVLVAIVYLNMVKNTTEFTNLRGPGDAFRSMPLEMKMPLFESISLPTRTWFHLAYGLLAACIVALLVRHVRRPLPFVPRTWLGKGQLLYLLFLWIVVIFNFEKALVGFGEQRLATEGVVFVNAVICTLLIALSVKEDGAAAAVNGAPAIQARSTWHALLAACAAALICAFVLTGLVRAVYGNKPCFSGAERGVRFGANAEWKLYPVLKTIKHR